MSEHPLRFIPRGMVAARPEDDKAPTPRPAATARIALVRDAVPGPERGAQQGVVAVLLEVRVGAVEQHAMCGHTPSARRTSRVACVASAVASGLSGSAPQ